MVPDAQERIRELQRLLTEEREARSVLLSTTAHELRTPLSAMKSLLGILPRSEPEDQEEILLDLGLAVDRLLSLIDNLLSLVRIESGTIDMDFRDCRPDRLVAQVTDLLSYPSRDLGIELVGDSDGGTMVADREKIAIILTNLASNALKYTPGGGSVRIEARSQAETWLFQVQDSGPGLDQEEMDRIFRRFVRLDGGTDQSIQGHGLGLAIARNFVELHGGRLWVDSEPGQGSLFSFTIPGKLRPGRKSLPSSWSRTESEPNTRR